MKKYLKINILLSSVSSIIMVQGLQVQILVISDSAHSRLVFAFLSAFKLVETLLVKKINILKDFNRWK